MLMVLGWIALGAITGLVPLRRVQWSVSSGVIAGAVGGVLGGWIYTRSMNANAMYFNLGSVGAAIAGAIVMLIVYAYTAKFQD
jgi:uncharacterized membrane protein YeaQ/YmgE (transglycosylase-associated protein family)